MAEILKIKNFLEKKKLPAAPNSLTISLAPLKKPTKIKARKKNSKPKKK
jgi:hypothetical protein